MITNKIFSVGVDIHRIDAYTKPDTNLMHILVDRFEGYCYKSCYIRKVLKIIRRSECVIDQDDLDAFGKVSVQFEAEVEILLSGEIINGCKVEKKNAHGVTICTRDNLVVGIGPNPLFNSIAEGQIISVRLINCKYQIGQHRITAQALPFMYQQSAVYQLSDALTDEDVEYLQQVMEHAGAERALYDKVPAESKKAFGNLIYAYTGMQKPPKGATTVDVTDAGAIKALSGVYIVRDLRSDLSTPDAFVYKDVNDVNTAYPDIEIDTTMPTRGIILNLIHDYIHHMRMVREMSEIYNTPELFAAHKNLWKIFKKLKRS